MDRFHPLIASRVFNTPLLIHPAKLDAIAGALYRQWGVSQVSDQPSAYSTLQGERREPGYRVIDKLAVIDIFGVLAHRGGVQAYSSYILGYQQIARRLEAALNDAQVEQIVLDIDSPGGEVSGVFELAEQISEAKQKKPIHSVADSLATSAAYLIGCSATEFSVSRTGYTGSIGVVWRHADFSEALKQEGIAVTHVYAGAKKVSGNQFEPLSAEVRAEFQEEIDKLYQMFVSAVVQHRGIKERAVRDTEAGIYLGQDGVDIGLVDRVETADQMISRLTQVTQPGAGSRQFANPRGKSTMSDDNQQTGGGEPNSAANQAAASTSESLAAATATGRKEGQTSERERVSAILNAEAAQGREEMAKHLAFKTDMSAEQSIALLEAAPKEAAAKSASVSRLDAAMSRTEQPNVGVDSASAESGEAGEVQSLASAIAAGANRAQR